MASHPVHLMKETEPIYNHYGLFYTITARKMKEAVSLTIPITVRAWLGVI
jgi:hypothetical protein